MANAPRCPAAILEAIPWYPDGLSSEECGAIEAHAADCRACRAELAFLRGEEEAIEVPDGDRIYANVIARIGARTNDRLPLGRRLRRRAAKQVSVAAGLLTALVSGMLTTGAIWVVRVTPTYETSAAVALPELGGPQIDVVFRPEATVEQVEATLRASEATIVSGPTPRGVYRLRIAPSGDVPRALEQLRGGGHGVAIFAEPAGSQEADSRSRSTRSEPKANEDRTG